MIRSAVGPVAAAMLIAVTAVALVGCSEQPVRIVTLGGEPWTVYQDTGDGMRQLPGFGDTDGMLFDLGSEVPPSGFPFVMDGVGFPLDIAWFDAAGALVSTTRMATCDAAPCPLYYADGPYRWAVEAPARAFADIVPTDRLSLGD